MSTMALPQMEAIATRLDELEQRIDGLALPDSIAVPNNFYFSEGSVKTLGESIGPYIDPFTEAGMPNWVQAVGGASPILGHWLPSPEGLKWVEADAGAVERMAMLKPEQYFEEGNLAKPVLGPYIAIMKFTFAPTRPVPIAEQTMLFGLRAFDLSNFPEHVNEKFDGGVTEINLKVRVCFNALHELELETNGFGGSLTKKKYEGATRTFWLVATCMPQMAAATPHPMYTFEVFDVCPFNWGTLGVGGAEVPIASVTVENGGTGRRQHPLFHTRLTLSLNSFNKEVGEKEVGALVNYFRVYPLMTSLIPNFA